MTVELLHPRTPTDVASIVRDASREGTGLLIVGGRAHIDRGNPSITDAELWTTQLDRIVAYDPAEMIAVVEAGVRCADLASELAASGQEWPVDAPAGATVGGVIAAGASSFRRRRVGHVRDTVVQMTIVTGDGRTVTSGARTVKNVSGFDLHRLLTGSLGTLGVIVQVALKVRPLPEAHLALRSRGGGLEAAGRALEAVPSAAAIVASPETTVVHLEGWSREVEGRAAAVRGVAPDADEIDVAVPDLPGGRTVVEVSLPPSRLAGELAHHVRWVALAGAGIGWVGIDGSSSGALAALRDRVHAAGGIAPAVRGPGGLGGAPVPAPQVQDRLRAAFDPAGILAPGRGWA